MKHSVLFPFILFIALSGTLFSCAQEAPGIDFDHAECAHCRMNVVDRQYGALLVTQKGRHYAYDDVQCMIASVADGTIAEGQVGQWYVCDHAHPGTLIDATKAFYALGPGFRSPMRGDAGAFATTMDRDAAMSSKEGVAIDWKALRETLEK